MKNIFFTLVLFIGFWGAAQDSIVTKIRLKGREYNIPTTVNAAATIADGSIQPTKLANADYGDFFLSGGVASLSLGSVGTTQISDASVTQGKIANSAINTDRVENGSLWPVDLNIANTGTVGQVLSKSGTNEFTWVDDQVGSGGGSSSYVVDETFTTSPYTPVELDTFKLKYGKSISTITINEPSGTFTDGHPITYVQDSTGVLEFDFPDIRKNVYFRTNAPGAIVMTHFTGSGWAFLCGECEEYTPTPPAPSNLFTGTNAMTPDGGEVNNALINDTNGGQVAISSQAIDPYNGSYVIEVENLVGGSVDGRLQCTGTVAGEPVILKFQGKQVVGLAWVIKLLSDEWDTTYTFNLDDGEATNWEAIEIAATPLVNDAHVTIRETSGGSVGDKYHVDYMIMNTPPEE